ncbi:MULTISPECIES: hypothetical protein [Streptomyces]|uniref:hypothetical protein n=1 Tax=Streptomyces TaxID=1883 RepID=UPI002E27EA45|nr:hypothetical protein [Streptomyces europaeiscabiei]
MGFAQFEGTKDRIALAERAVVLTVLFEPVVRLLRPLAQEDANHRRVIAVRAGGASIRRNESPSSERARRHRNRRRPRHPEVINA